MKKTFESRLKNVVFHEVLFWQRSLTIIGLWEISHVKELLLMDNIPFKNPRFMGNFYCKRVTFDG